MPPDAGKISAVCTPQPFCDLSEGRFPRCPESNGISLHLEIALSYFVPTKARPNGFFKIKLPNEAIGVQGIYPIIVFVVRGNRDLNELSMWLWRFQGILLRVSERGFGFQSITETG